MQQVIKDVVKSNKFLFKLIFPILELKRRIIYRDQIFFDNFFSNIIEGKLIVRVDNIKGIYEIDARSHILKRILISKEYEPEIVNFILKNIDPEKDAINIGANIGLYTNLLANNINSNCKVLAVEPTPNAYKLLEANVCRNDNSSNVILYNGVASDSSGSFKINIVPGNEEYSSMGEISHFSIRDKGHISVEVLGETIDNLVDKNGLRPGIIVIDVEGAENNVLVGAIETLKKYHPVIITELDDNLLVKQNSDSRKVIKLLESLGYRIIDFDNKSPEFPFMGNIIAEYKNV